ncbi:NAD-dependent dehydratase [Hahella sp. CCB-MM4]|uniref:NAD(P)-dependent oxidoreductase n=1 Tax=Hahella sp. (strain CCB-MM4) TaxID=1926491 RepID=UPI000B9A40B7|nr:NAD(P)-dependent oxidoreductase [Hahella sp. CCB-MM4]OZG74465.1 NAD-dependent dehydratase [Hahella sp. CCB-MM4]
MKIAIFGATGWIGGTIAQEALNRGHEIVALVRDTSKLPTHDHLTGQAFDLTDNASLASLNLEADVVIASIGGRAAGNHEITPDTARKLLEELPKANINRLYWVGGAGSLEAAPGITLLSNPEFPEAYKGEALAQSQALEVFRKNSGSVDWTFISPAAEIFPGEKSGQYRVGGDSLLVDEEGKSRISVQDYAAAMLDQVENNAHPNERIGVAY